MKSPGLTHKIFPFLQWWPLVNRNTLKSDLLAGLTGAVIVLPQGVAFAMIAGLPPEYGLYTAMITPVIAALFGSSYHLISGPTTAISIVVFAALSEIAEPGSYEFIQLALTLAFMAGAFQLILGLARMGTLVNFVSHSVVIGFTAGAALLIMTSQMKHIFGIDIPRGASFLSSWKMILMGLPQTNFYILTVSLSTLASALLVKKFFPKLPYMLFAMFFGAIVSLLLDGPVHGVTLVGELPSHLPSPSLPNLSSDVIKVLAGNAFAIGLLGLIEAVSIAKAIASHSQQHIDGNQEFIGQGLSNLVGSFFSSYPGSGSFTRSGVNFQAGAKTPIAAIFAAVFLALILLLVAPLTAYLPIPAMGGIILLVGYNLIDFHHISQVFKANRKEFGVLLVTFLGTLFLELEFAIYLGVILSLIFYLQRTSKPGIVTLSPDPDATKRQFVNIARVPLPECPQLKMIRIDGSLFFGAVDHVSSYLNELADDNPDINRLLIIASGINFLDLAGAELLVKESKRWNERGGGLYICGMKKTGRELMHKGGFWDEIGRDHFFWTKPEAIKYIYSKLSHSICESCTSKIFLECRGVTVVDRETIFQE
ncbi:MAG: SulP family inorganic anion transporter [Bacteroidetes bacterium]|nr:SulP family inorganic anion transporter [Bacteroidota bacterium]